MEYENERILKLIFPTGIPEHLQNNPELDEYLYKLGTYKVDQLKKEETRLSEENKSVVEHTQDLAISNYKTFIQTSDCSKHIFKEFKDTEQKLDRLIEKLPDLTQKCELFISASSDINSSRRLNSLTLKKNAQLLEILELPQLMDTCIREGKYEEALELAGYVQRLGTKHSGIPVINSIVLAIEGSWHTMLKQLLAQLKTELQLPKCLQVVGYLRRMQAFSTVELKLVFLQSRDIWLTKILDNIPADDAQQHLMKTIELTRVNLFTIITQYKATFADEETALLTNTDQDHGDFNSMYYSWLNKRIEIFLQTLERDLQQGIDSIETVLGQCMYFGLSFSRVGADFRGLMAPIFSSVILSTFNAAIFKVTRQFEADMESFTLINKIPATALPSSAKPDGQLPPETLLDYYPLAVYCNGVLTALNDLRHCSPIAMANEVTVAIQNSLETVAKQMFNFYRQEQQAFGVAERDNFGKFCSCFAYDLLPYMQRCVHVLFPPSVLIAHLGINAMALQKEGFTYIGQRKILEPLERLLPNKVETIVMHEIVETTAVEQEKPLLLA